MTRRADQNERKKDPDAVSLGKRGGARRRALSREERLVIAAKAAATIAARKPTPEPCRNCCAPSVAGDSWCATCLRYGFDITECESRKNTE